ncbi:MAG: hypothetical protein HUU14_08575 [Dehalococcoidia bacterium]|nr:hypothetical protein [Chloroflexi bacterium CFX7]NUQ55922.1 hypothetical protein [Dehalococcoidia bacterium]
MKQGTMVTVYLVPVHEGRMVTFDVRAREAQGRWLPWSVLEFAGNPYMTASELADDWCDGAISDLSLVDVMSFNPPGGGWELAIVFRAELTALPRPREDRTPAVFDPGRFDAIGPFDPVDLQRWVEWRAPAGKALATPRKGGELLF